MQRVTCQACGRVHKWREEMAGTEFLCHCGEWVYCPAPGDSGYIDELPELSKAEALARDNEFEVDHGFDGQGSASGSGVSVESSPEMVDDISAEVGEIDVADVTAAEASQGAVSLKRRKGRVKAATGRGLLGLSAFPEMCVWIAASMLGFTFAVLALTNPSHRVYIVLAVLIGPMSWWMLRRSYLTWKRGRKLVLAIDEQLTKEKRTTA